MMRNGKDGNIKCNRGSWNKFGGIDIWRSTSVDGDNRIDNMQSNITRNRMNFKTNCNSGSRNKVVGIELPIEKKPWKVANTILCGNISHFCYLWRCDNNIVENLAVIGCGIGESVENLAIFCCGIGESMAVSLPS